MFRKEGRSIIFVTEPLLKFIGLPTNTPQQVYSSKILHRDLFDIVEGAERESTAQLRRTLKLSINAGRCFSTPCALKSQLKTKLLEGTTAEGVKYGTLHLTPLRVSHGLATGPGRYCRAADQTAKDRRAAARSKLLAPSSGKHGRGLWPLLGTVSVMIA